ncbi:MAG: sulfide/dihydroorotate dehydrogenase-like FAD/NAD-binding protein [Candidatus Eisenbacteria bacterium]
MFRILEARFLAPTVKCFRIEAPKIAEKRKAGQFVIIRVAPNGERIPLTIADADVKEGWISIIVQSLGKTTKQLNSLEAGDQVTDVVGPLGKPSDIGRVGTVVVIGGGVGTAIAYPTAVSVKRAGNHVCAIIGGRTKELVILEKEMRAICDEVYPTTDDGSYGFHGLVTDKLSELIDAGRAIHHVLAIGPVPMMRAVAQVTKPLGIPTTVSLNPIMVDGTGMCGGCRVRVGGETYFACVDGPEFDAHEVDFELLQLRNRSYLAFEKTRDGELEKLEPCKMREAIAELQDPERARVREGLRPAEEDA